MVGLNECASVSLNKLDSSEEISSDSKVTTETKPNKQEATLTEGDETKVNQIKKRDIGSKTVESDQLETQETGYLPPPAYQSTDSDYGYDSGKNVYGKQGSDWSLYDQGELKIMLHKREYCNRYDLI